MMANVIVNFLLTLLYVIAVLFLYKIVVFVYNVYIMRKKLKHIPGFTAVPYIGTLVLTRQKEEVVKETHKLINRLALDRFPWFLSLLHKFNDGIFQIWIGHYPYIFIYKPEMIKVILSSTTHIEKSVMYKFFEEWLGNGLLNSFGKQWVRDRKLLSPTFHFNILERFGVIIFEKTENLIKNLEKKIAEDPSKAINIMPIIDNFSLEVVFDTMMGVEMHTQEARSNYINCVQRMLQLISERVTQPWFLMNWLFHLFPKGKEHRKLLNNMSEFTKFVIRKKQLKRKMEKSRSENNYNFETADKPERKTFLDHLLDLNDNENKMLSDEELKTHVDTFMFAAHDTTSATLSWALFCIGNNLEHQEKLYEEINNVLPDSHCPITMTQLSQLNYLDRVIKESLRLYATAPFISRKISDDINLDGYTIPKNTMIFIPIFMLHRNPTVWPNPSKFDPDRFLPENMKQRHPYAFIPFSAGPRNCIGQRYALLEVKIVLIAILRKWRVKSVETPEELAVYDTIVLRPFHGAIQIRLLPRK